MTHTLRKYLNNRGSALFMVISTMTALLIAVMAMYFSVVSSRTVQFTVFNQEQAYQSAISIQDAITCGANEKGMQELLQYAHTNLEIGETISTKGNKFLAFGGTEEDLENIGAYDITVTRLNPEGKRQAYDIATTMLVNGVSETTHTIIYIDPPSKGGSGVGSTDIFCSTGYVPNNSYLDGGTYFTKSTYDNEYVVIGATGNTGGSLNLKDDVFCGGSMEIDYNTVSSVEKPITFVVRDTLYYNANQAFVLGTTTNRGKLYIGLGGLYNKPGNWPKFQNMDIYVLGDIYMADGGAFKFENCTVHVDGNFYYKEGDIPTNLEINGSIYKLEGGSWKTITGYPKWADAEADEVVEFIKSRTASHEFQKWEIDDKNFTDEVTVTFNSGWQAHDSEGVTYSPMSMNYNIDWTSTTNEQYVKIKDVVDICYGKDGDSQQINDYTLFLDTGKDKNNILYLDISANRDLDGDGTKESFSWNPISPSNPDGNPLSSATVIKVIYKGRGSVVVNVGEGVQYISNFYEVIMHESWFTLLGGAAKTETKAGTTTTYYKFPGTVDGDFVSKFIHTNCSSDCTYTETEGGECPLCKETMTTLSCDKHFFEMDTCETADCPNNIFERGDDDKFHDLCINRIDKNSVDSYLNSNSSVKNVFPHYYLTPAGKEVTEDEKAADEANGIDTTGYTKSYIYPTINFFVVSCDESAEIHIANIYFNNEIKAISDNRFFGFVYAPYMTYEGIGSSGSGIRFCGGMVVSDYILRDHYGYVNCYPTKLPSQLGADDGQLAHASKNWKIEVARH